MTSYHVLMHLRPNGPAVSGTWSTEEAARRRYREWVGLYGEGDADIQLLTEERDGQRRVLKSWPPQNTS